MFPICSFIPFISKEVYNICNEIAKLKGDDSVKRETIHTIVEQLIDELSKRYVIIMCATFITNTDQESSDVYVPPSCTA